LRGIALADTGPLYAAGDPSDTYHGRAHGAVANLYGLLATKILAQDIFDRRAHLLLEPEDHIAGIISRAHEDQLVVDGDNCKRSAENSPSTHSAE
jgi:hypothetical protein